MSTGCTRRSTPAGPVCPSSTSRVETVDALYDGEPVDLVERPEFASVADLPCHTGLVLHSARGSALARITADKQVRPRPR